MLSVDIFSNNGKAHTSWLEVWRKTFFCLKKALGRRRGNVAELRTARELAYLAAAEDHADLERRLAALENKHPRVGCRLQTWPG